MVGGWRWTALLWFICASKSQVTSDIRDTHNTRNDRKLESNLFERTELLPDVVATDSDLNSELLTEVRIVGGVPATPGEYPFYVHVANGTLCGGTLIWPDVVLTAAHCQRAWSTTTAFVGSTDIAGRDGAEIVTIERFTPHPNYNSQNEENDIMLVLLATPSSAPLVTLNRNPNLPVDGDDVTVIGFGRTSEGGEVSNILLEVGVQVVGIDRCRLLLPGLIFPDTHICAGVNGGGRDSCEGIPVVLS